MITKSAGSFSALLLTAFLISSLSQGADIPATQLPSPHLTSTDLKVDSESRLILRDAGIGLGIGAIVGLGFIALAPGGFSPQHSQMQTDAMGTGLFVGLAGGILTGLWEVKRNRLMKLSVNPGDFKTQPASLSTTLSF